MLEGNFDIWTSKKANRPVKWHAYWSCRLVTFVKRIFEDFEGFGCFQILKKSSVGLFLKIHAPFHRADETENNFLLTKNELDTSHSWYM